MERERELKLRPIGWVTKGSRWPEEGTRREERQAEIQVDSCWVDALEGLDGFSHIWVLWWLDRFDTPPASPKVHPEGRQDVPAVGLFATRSPRRPNPLAITAVRLRECHGSRLVVEGLDACEGSPVLDIKPYLRRGDQIDDVQSPEWLERLWRIHDAERDE
jgi:tRNA-Thr(GGU) m(6)t(6)A37 methyltransferase TsaA